MPIALQFVVSPRNSPAGATARPLRAGARPPSACRLRDGSRAKQLARQRRPVHIARDIAGDKKNGSGRGHAARRTAGRVSSLPSRRLISKANIGRSGKWRDALLASPPRVTAFALHHRHLSLRRAVSAALLDRARARDVSSPSSSACRTALLVWGTKTILERLSPAAQHASPAGAAGVSSWEVTTHNFVDPWLPRVGRADRCATGHRRSALPPAAGRPARLQPVAQRGLHGLGERARRERLALRRSRQAAEPLARLLQSLDHGRSPAADQRRYAALNRCLSVGFMDAVKEPFTMLGITIALCAIDWKLTLGAHGAHADLPIPGQRPRPRARDAAGQGIQATISQSSLLVEMLTASAWSKRSISRRSKPNASGIFARS